MEAILPTTIDYCFHSTANISFTAHHFSEQISSMFIAMHILLWPWRRLFNYQIYLCIKGLYLANLTGLCSTSKSNMWCLKHGSFQSWIFWSSSLHRSRKLETLEKPKVQPVQKHSFMSETHVSLCLHSPCWVLKCKTT